MKLLNIDGNYINPEKVVAIKHVNAPSGHVDKITTDIIFDFAIGNEPYKIHIARPIGDVLKVFENFK